MAKKVNKLSDLEVDEVSLVDRGANQHASVEFYKNLGEEGVEKNSPDQSAVHVDEPLEDEEDEEVEKSEEGSGSYFSKLVKKVLSLDFATSSANSDTMSPINKMTPGLQMPYGHQTEGYPEQGPTNEMGPEAGMQVPEGDVQVGPEIPEEVLDYIQELEDQLAELTGEPIEGDEPMQEEEAMFGKNYTDDDEVAFLSELAKSLHDEDQRESVAKAEQLVKRANDRAEEAERIAKAERDHRLNQEFVSKARALTNLPVSATEFGPVLKKLHDVLSEEEVALVEKALSAANETTAQYFEEVGKRGTNAMIDGRLDDVAKSLVEKNSDMTMEQARAKALEADPSLYDEYLNDRSA